MGDWLELMSELSMPVKAGWLIWLVWGIVQVVWFRRTRTPAVVPVKASKRSSRPSLSRRSRAEAPLDESAAATPAETSSEFLSTLGLRDGTTQYNVEMGHARPKY
jgi:hypothetical protein